jgi:hypothetical protein
MHGHLLTCAAGALLIFGCLKGGARAYTRAYAGAYAGYAVACAEAYANFDEAYADVDEAYTTFLSTGPLRPIDTGYVSL